jgi:hypothetical protein
MPPLSQVPKGGGGHLNSLFSFRKTALLDFRALLKLCLLPRCLDPKIGQCCNCTIPRVDNSAMQQMHK